LIPVKNQIHVSQAHAVAYTISCLRIAWFKVYYPEAYYCAYFTVRADEFDSTLMCQPPAVVRRSRAEVAKPQPRLDGPRSENLLHSRTGRRNAAARH
jgi:DNA polymerase-3 subunit alpha (Gram-positive type)